MPNRKRTPINRGKSNLNPEKLKASYAKNIAELDELLNQRAISDLQRASLRKRKKQFQDALKKL